jgi:hypothetical protein
MACHFCLGYCSGLGAVQRNLLSLRHAYGDDAIREHDYRHVQAYETAMILSAEASDLRMFFCVEVGQKLIERTITTGPARDYQLTELSDFDWFQRAVPCTADGLKELIVGADKTLDVIGAIDLEMKIRSSASTLNKAGVGMPSLVSGVMAQRQIEEYRRYVAKTREFMSGRGHRRADHDQYDRLGVLFTDFLGTVEMSYDHYFTIFNYMAQITDGSTISPWTTKLPIFQE